MAHELAHHVAHERREGPPVQIGRTREGPAPAGGRLRLVPVRNGRHHDRRCAIGESQTDSAWHHGIGIQGQVWPVLLDSAEGQKRHDIARAVAELLPGEVCHQP